jgi:nickel-dependent lactate racemase
MNNNLGRKEVILPYGRGELRLNVPAQAQLLCSRSDRRVEDIPAAVRAALEAPVAGQGFSRWAEGAERVLVVVSDQTRTCHNREILPVVLHALNAAGVQDDRIRVLVAYGAHRAMSEAQTTVVLGEEVMKRVHVYHHDARAESDLVYLRDTKRGTPIALNKLAVDADRVLLTGAIMPHYFAGFTGGRKSICPGLAGLETIVANHRLTVHTDPQVGLDRFCKSGVLDGNPVHEDLVEAAETIGDVFCLNLVAGADAVAGVVAGDMIEAHEQGSSIAAETVRAVIGEPADIVVASCGGYPADIDLVQVHKALRHAREALRDGGRLLFVAECAEGVGSPYIERWLDYREVADMYKAMRANYTLNSQTALSLRMITTLATVFMRSSLPEATIDKLGCRPVAAWEGILEETIGNVLPTETVYVMPDAAYTVPEIDQGGRHAHPDVCNR